jgi:cytochrome b561/polyisoprenoid-binding protein YceI
MSFASTATRYGALDRSLHWLTVLLIAAAIALGLVAHGLPFDTPELLDRKALLFSLHKTVGVTLFAVALVRIAAAALQPRPALLHPDRRLEAFLARTVHRTLYACLVLVPLTGWITHAATTGFAPILWPFGQSLPFVPKSDALAATAAGLHKVFERVLVAAILLHVAGALKHHLVDRDATLRRMLSGAEVPVPPAGGEGAGPLVAAGAVFALALGVGAALGVYGRESAAAQVAKLAEVETGWKVETGSLGFTVRQFGAEVAGSLADWTAAIEFAETPDAAGTHGTVEVTIAIGSLALGSVTAQALGADYFDAAGFPTATFAATIRGRDGGYLAEGTLTLRGATVPVALPFTLAMAGDRARMEGSVTLDRRDFGIGSGQTNEASLGFAVPVSVVLEAVRATPQERPASP